jgi:pilus assembly protein FimV
LQVDSPDLSGVQQRVDDTPVAEAPVDPEQPVAEAPEPTAEATEEPAAEQPAAPPAPRATTAAEEPAGPSLAERLGQFWWVLVVLGLLALVFVFVRRRRGDSSSLDALDTPAPVDYEPPARRSTPSLIKAREPEPFVAADEPLDEFEEPAPVTARRESPSTRPIEPVAEPVETSVDDTLSSDTAIRLDQQDALAEADFHMAYGLYDQAADLVKIAIDREPGRRDLKLKLLEIYFVWGNKDLFLETARELHATRSEAAPGEWDKVLIMGKQIAADDSMFQGDAASAHVDLVDVNLEGGENRVDVDLFAEPEADKPAGLDLEFASGERKGPEDESDLDFLLDEPKRGEDEDATRELDPLARTQETPTIESPMLERGDATIREKADTSDFGKLSAEQTAEISLDDLGLDAETMDHSRALEDTTSIEKDGDTVESARPLHDDEMTQLAPSLSSFDRTMEAPRVEKFDVESTGTIYIDQVDLSGGDTVEQPRADIDSTASMKSPVDLDLDLDALEEPQAGNDSTIRAPKPDADEDRFSSDVFSASTADSGSIDLDVGEPLSADDHSPTNKQSFTTEMELSELEPVTMSEVGTKLDLARAYMDMGDPDGARSILEEVMQEGNPNQKQEANRLLESIR